MATSFRIALLLFLAGLSIPVAQATTIIVDSAADDMSVNGTCTLRKAIEAANTDTAIDTCPAGTTTDTIVFDASLTGATIALLHGPLLIDSDVVIDGQNRAITVDAQGGSRVVKIEPTRTVQIRGLTLTGGVATNGGAILSEGSLELVDVTVENNQADGHGGGIFSATSGPASVRATLTCQRVTVRGNVAGNCGGIYSADAATINESIITRNAATFGQGGLCNVAGALTLTNSEVLENEAPAQGGISNTYTGVMTIGLSIIARNSATSATGGGISNSGTLTVLDAEIRENDAHFGGGGIYNDGTLTLIRTNVLENESHNVGGGIDNSGTIELLGAEIRDNIASGEGGGIVFSGTSEGDNLIEGSLIAGNTAGEGGGIHLIASSFATWNLTLEGTTIAANSASASGGGLSMRNSNATSTFDVTLSQVTIATNTAGQSGGGLHVDDMDPVILQSTVTDNTAPEGGGLFLENTGSVQLGGTIVSGNTGTAGIADLDHEAGTTITSDGWNLIGDTSASTSFTQPSDLVGVTDPGLGALQDNGGLTATALPLVGSPAIDASAAVVCGAFSTDQRGIGFARLIDGDGDGSVVCDIGATEAPEPSCENVVVNTTDDGTAGTLRYEIGCADPGTTITFATALDGQTIALNGTQLALTKDLTIDAEGQDITVQQTGAERVVVVQVTTTIDLIGLTLTGGLVSGDGGAILNEGTLRLTDMTLRDNRAEQGGGVFNRGTLTLVGTTLEVNMVSRNGGGIFNEGIATLTGSTISGNRAELNGGGILNDGSMTLHEGEVNDNEAANGGGILNFSGDLTLTASTVRDNLVGQDGGGVFVGGGAAAVVRSTVSGNQAGTDGGGILIRGLTSMKQASVAQQPSLLLEQSTVAENAAGSGGGGLLVGEEASVMQSTISANQALTTGGALVEGGGTLGLGGTIVSGNTSQNASADVHVVQQGQATSQGYNLIGQTNTGVFVEPGDRDGVLNPGLTPLADNGGATSTMALQPTSPALDGSDKNVCDAFDTDQRGSGYARERDGNGDGTPVCDVGAYEAAPSGSGGSTLTVLYTSPPGFSRTQLQSTLQGLSTEAVLDATGDGVPELVLLKVDALGEPQEIQVVDGLSNTVLAVYDAQQILAATGTGEVPFVGFFEVDGDPGLETLFAVDGAVLFDDTKGEEQVYFATSPEQRYAGVVDMNLDGRADLVLYDTAQQVVQVIGWVGGTASARVPR